MENNTSEEFNGDNEEINKRISTVASALHEDWRQTRLQEDGSYEPRIKSTTDQNWIEARGTDQVDIANTQYDDLPSDWQAENKAAATVLENLLTTESETDINDPANRERIGSIIHEAWLSRNDYARGGELDVPFAQLSKEEQDKDIDQFIIAAEVLKSQV